jgi:hypothetical protein
LRPSAIASGVGSSTAQLLGGEMLAAAAQGAAWLRNGRATQQRRMQLYAQATAVALAAWGRGENDVFRLDPDAYRRCRDAIDQAGVLWPPVAADNCATPPGDSAKRLPARARRGSEPPPRRKRPSTC